MSALMEYKPNPDDRDALKDFLSHHNLSKALAKLLSSMTESDSIFFFTGDREFSTQDAANALNVSRPYLIDLLKDGVISFRMVGKHRRVNIASLLRYKSKMELENKKIADELTAIAQEHNLG